MPKLLHSILGDPLIKESQDVGSLPAITGCHWVQADYEDKESLVRALEGIEVVLSFITTQTDPGNQSQKNLIDASIQAGVKRFAPGEWTGYV